MLRNKNSFIIILILFSLVSSPVLAEENTTANKISSRDDYRWMGHDFVFCFVTDDGRVSNQVWADVGREMDFRFTIAVNTLYTVGDFNLSPEQIHELWVDGFEIANHSYSHGMIGLPEACSMPPRGSMGGYFLCPDIDPVQAMIDFTSEIERDSLATRAQIPVQDIKSFAYPRHIHTIAIIDSLIAEGYTGARMGSKWQEESTSYGDYTTYPTNSWDDGLSLFRMPNITTTSDFFGNHSAVPPVHKTYEDFLAVAQPYIDQTRASGGAFIIFDHHLGNDDDSLGNINYASGGITAQDLEWIVDLVRANGGVVMTFGDMCEYYKARSSRVEIAGDYIWKLSTTSVVDPLFTNVLNLRNYPNPFNPRTIISFTLAQEGLVNASIYNAAGQLITILAKETFPAGEQQLTWSGFDQKGHSVPAGIYFVRVQANGKDEAHKLILLK